MSQWMSQWKKILFSTSLLTATFSVNEPQEQVRNLPPTQSHLNADFPSDDYCNLETHLTWSYWFLVTNLCIVTQRRLQNLKLKNYNIKGSPLGFCSEFKVHQMTSMYSSKDGCLLLPVCLLRNIQSILFLSRQSVAKIYSLTQCRLTVNECDWHILVAHFNSERINSHYLTRRGGAVAWGGGGCLPPGWGQGVFACHVELCEGQTTPSP